MKRSPPNKERQKTSKARTGRNKKYPSILALDEFTLLIAKDAAKLGIYAHDIGSGVIRWDERIREIWGVGRDVPITYELFMSGVHPEDRALVQATVNKAADPSGNGEFYLEHRVMPLDHEAIRWVTARGHILFDQGKPARIIGTIQDITDRKRSEEALKLQAALIDLTPDAIMILLPNRTIKFWNQGAESLYGWSKEEALMQISHKLLQTEFPEELGRIEHKLQMQGKWTGELIQQTSDGRKVAVQSIWLAQYDAHGNISEILESNTDITERKRSEDEIKELLSNVQEERDRLSALVSSIPDEIWFTDSQKRFTLANPSALHEFDLASKEDVDVEELAASLEVFRVDGSPRPIDEAPPLRALQGEIVKNYEEVLRTPASGELRYRQVNASPVRNTDGEIIGSVSVVRDITERKQAEEALRERDERLQTIFENAEEIIHMISWDGTFLYLSPSWERFTGFSVSESIGKSLVPYVHPDDQAACLEQVRNVHETGKPHKILEFRVRHASGKWIWFMNSGVAIKDAEGKPLYFMGVATDITERKLAEEELHKHRENLEALVKERTLELEEKNKELGYEISERKKLEEQLLQSQKIEALGSFAGGIAHDLNNILYPIVINTETLLDEAESGTQDYEMLNQTLDAAYRQRDLIKQILAFSRKGVQKLSPVKVIPLLESTLRFVRSTVPSTIEIRHSINAPLDTIMGDPTQIQQIVMNLCRNAADAMDNQQGTIEVNLSNVHLETNPALPEIKPGEYLELEVQDNGHGIRPEIIGRIFDPFFTTKPTGKGSGLGLSVVYGIVNKFGGAVTVTSKYGEGALFTVYLPLYKQESKAHMPDKKSPDTLRKRILVVDDEDIVITSLQRVLERLGYSVTASRDAQEALDLFRKNPEEVDLVITDMTMPKMTGIELGKRIMKIRPEIPVILCTGFSDLVDEEGTKAAGLSGLLMKPAGIGELKEAIHRALGH